ncbi:leucine-rich repeat domain, L domain-like protein [Artemisia annua]|uniref:Leucine-rich repeat domain, L domain-like protein n=1 Tax=Artemisia annua TaxID=35608 RepID=A0A2U1P2K7_ARTAN|nr:leucine-rich repeat domain, L domain-like protein [Artemisia annua]
MPTFPQTKIYKDGCVSVIDSKGDEENLCNRSWRQTKSMLFCSFENKKRVDCRNVKYILELCLQEVIIRTMLTGITRVQKNSGRSSNGDTSRSWSLPVVDVPEEINKLMNMQRLILANNIIGRLPMNIGKLQSLKFIMLDGNQLTTLPDEVYSCQRNLIKFVFCCY